MALSQDYKRELKVKAAYYYYKKDMKLADIADELNISRVTLNKLLKEAMEEGIVRIDIIDQDNTIGILEMQQSVKERFELTDIVIVNSTTGSYYDVAHAAARMVDGMMRDGIKISLTWGATLELLVDFLNGSNHIKDIEVYTLVGAQGRIGMKMQPNTIAQNLLGKYKGTGYVVNAPFICETVETAQSIMRDGSFTEIVDKARESDITLVGIGPTPNTAASISDMRYDIETVKELKNSNVCGDICSNFYDIYGNLTNNSLCDRFVKVSLDELKQHKNVVGIASGDHKVASILGALNGGYLDTLITDRSTMVSVLEMADRLGL